MLRRPGEDITLPARLRRYTRAKKREGAVGMAWSWSYTNEGMEAAYENLRALPRLLLREIYAEWEASYQPIGDDGEEKLYAERELDSKAYDRFMEVDSPLPNDVMADSIWKCAERQSCCDNGAWLVWLCPFGCERHKVKPD